MKTGSKLIITEKKYENKINTRKNLFILDALNTQKELLKESSENLNLPLSAHNLAYMIYTSGTTGKPKGVMQTHYSLLTLFFGAKHLYKNLSSQLS